MHADNRVGPQFPVHLQPSANGAGAWSPLLAMVAVFVRTPGTVPARAGGLGRAKGYHPCTVSAWAPKVAQTTNERTVNKTPHRLAQSGHLTAGHPRDQGWGEPGRGLSHWNAGAAAMDRQGCYGCLACPAPGEPRRGQQARLGSSGFTSPLPPMHFCNVQHCH